MYNMYCLEIVNMKKKLFIAVAICFWGCKRAVPTEVESKNAMVVSARKEASQIGIDIIKKGGNAFDASIAVELALAVTFPVAGNLGGGGFMVYRKKDGAVGSLDFREKAPLLAKQDMYLDSLGNVLTGKSVLGAAASGVPGTVAGLFEIHKKFGSLPIETLFEPAIKLARKGFVVTSKQARRIDEYLDKIIEQSGSNTLYSKSYKAGDTIKNLAIARTLKIISKQGAHSFYSGELASQIADFIQKKGGYISVEDLKQYEVKERNPIKFKYKDLNIISMPPPSSGGICLGQILKMVEPYLDDTFEFNSLKYIQLIVEASRRAYADRSVYLGDPDFYKVPTHALLDNRYLKQRMENFSFDKATPSSAIREGVIVRESDQTTHFSIVDNQGNAVSFTTTINGAYGSKLYSEKLGFFFNNEMDDFSIKPGIPNMFGLLGGQANKIEPQKRMLSSMTPTIIEKQGKLSMVVGTPGGSTIITSVLQTILNVYQFKMNMQQAVAAPRFHHQWYPDDIKFEPKQFSKTLFDNLKKRGYQIDENNTPIIGKVDAILITKQGTLQAGADPRGDDAAVGF